MKKNHYIILIIILLICCTPIPLMACTCNPPCTGCQKCVNGICVDDDSKCGEGEFCYGGVCCECDDDEDCPVCYICPHGGCSFCICWSGLEYIRTDDYKSQRCTNCEFKFIAGDVWGLGPDCIKWLAPDGIPEEGTGETFITKWAEPGEYTVGAYTCGKLRAITTVKVSELVEINAVAIGKNTSSDPIYLANDYYDEPDKRKEHYLWWIEPIFNDDVPYDLPCFGWINHGVWLDPGVPPSTYLWFKDHGGDGDDFWVDANPDCKADGLGRLDAVVEGIDIIAEGIDPDKEPDVEEGTGGKNYNVSLNENFDQQLGSGPCYNVDHSDDTLTGDQMDEIGTITINTYTYGDNQATVRFNSGYGDNIKLFKNLTEKVIFDFDYPASEFSNTTLYVEGIESGTATLTAILRTQEYTKVPPGYWPFQARDKINIKVHRLNLEAVDPAPSGEDEDERDRNEICDKDNLIIAVNNNDSDNDGIIDSDPNDTEIAGGDPDLAHIKLINPLYGVTDLEDVTGTVKVYFPSNVKAYLNNDKTGGALPATYQITVEELYSIIGTSLNIYLEGVSNSIAILDTEIKAEMTLNSNVKCRDEIRYTVCASGCGCNVNYTIGGWIPMDEPFPSCISPCDGSDGDIKIDDCGNTLEIMCAQADGTGGLLGCAWRYFYNGTLVSSCIWEGGTNLWLYKYKIFENGERQFYQLSQVSQDYNCNEGCPGKCCALITNYDCETGESSICWRTSEEVDGHPKEYISDCDDGEPCPGH